MKGRIIAGVLIVLCTALTISIVMGPGLERTGAYRGPRYVMRTVATALETYRSDHGVYPSMAPLLNVAKFPDQAREAGGEGLSTLVARPRYIEYAAGLLVDEYVPSPELPIAYHMDESGWILFSAGPDRLYDIRQPAEVYSGKLSLEEQKAALLPLTYDPTNGAGSKGDVWRVQQEPLIKP